ncbi:hypothetical protein F4810DRAFT_705425 [Camillea tinctor]|nr:hypothetical protein F4810DRAFT_705425 [Camillea tinctor]
MWFMNWRQPHPDPGYPLPIESHPHRDSQQEAWQQLFHPQQFIAYNAPVSQLLRSPFMPQTTMEGQYYTGGDESSVIEDLFSVPFPDIGMGTPNTTAQTAAANVSSAAFGRDYVPNHSQTNDRGLAGNEQMGFPRRYPTANAYNPSLEETFGQRSGSWQYNPAALRQQGDYSDFQDGLPNNDFYPPMPIFGESSEYGVVTPAMTNDVVSPSMGSSAASDRMALMTLDPAPAQDTASTVNPESNLGDTWPTTISPKMLQISPSPTPKTSSESMRNDLVSGSSLDMGSALFDQQHARMAYSSSSRHSRHKTRKELPDKPRRHCSTLSESYSPAPSENKRAPIINPRPILKHEVMPEAQGLGPQLPHMPRTPQVPLASQTPATPVDAERSAKNEFLVAKKLEGMTYREIRAQGNFVEAESTLRGRFRTLTKNKEARVRKPEWQDIDIRLLKKAVKKLARGDDSSSTKVPWKQVADYITDHGGSYHFGNATCRKKWDELVDENTDPETMTMTEMTMEHHA